MAKEQEITEAPFRNKVAESGILTLDLAPFIPTDESLVFFDLKPFLFREMILREKDFRAALPEVKWEEYAGKHVALGCSVDAVIPVWAYMLATSFLQPHAASVHFTSLDSLKSIIIMEGISTINRSGYEGQRVVLKGCGDVAVPAEAYVAATAHLRPVVKSLMYGEPCSTVPVYKQSIKR
ncbi:MAG: DUF2480 family protein [Chitinophagaceae bacterium]